MFIRFVFLMPGRQSSNRLAAYGLLVQDGNRPQLVTVIRIAGETWVRPEGEERVKHPALRYAMRNFFVSQPQLARVDSNTVQRVSSQCEFTKGCASAHPAIETSRRLDLPLLLWRSAVGPKGRNEKGRQS